LRKALVGDFSILFFARAPLVAFDLALVRIGMELSCERQQWRLG